MFDQSHYQYLHGGTGKKLIQELLNSTQAMAEINSPRCMPMHNQSRHLSSNTCRQERIPFYVMNCPRHKTMENQSICAICATGLVRIKGSHEKTLL